METVSNEILFKIFEFLDVRDLFTLVHVCKRFYFLCQDHITWRRLRDANFCNLYKHVSVAKIIQTILRCPHLVSIKLPIVSRDIAMTLVDTCTTLQHLELELDNITGLDAFVQTLIQQHAFCASLRTLTIAATESNGVSMLSFRGLLHRLSSATNVSISGGITTFQVPFVPQVPIQDPDADGGGGDHNMNLELLPEAVDHARREDVFEENADVLVGHAGNNDDDPRWVVVEQDDVDVRALAQQGDADLNVMAQLQQENDDDRRLRRSPRCIEVLRILKIASCGLQQRMLERIYRVYSSLEVLHLAAIIADHRLGSFTSISWPRDAWGTTCVLATLILEDLHSLEAIHVTNSLCSSLETLVVKRCPNLQTLQTTASCAHLRTVTIEDCPALHECIIESPVLSTLDLTNAMALTLLKLRCVRLKDLCIRGCSQLSADGVATLLSAERTLPMLRTLDVTGCVSLRHSCIAQLLASWDRSPPDLDDDDAYVGRYTASGTALQQQHSPHARTPGGEDVPTTRQQQQRQRRSHSPQSPPAQLPQWNRNDSVDASNPIPLSMDGTKTVNERCLDDDIDSHSSSAGCPKDQSCGEESDNSVSEEAEVKKEETEGHEDDDDHKVGAGCHTLAYGGLGRSRLLIACWQLKHLELYRLEKTRDLVIVAPQLQSLSLEYTSREIDLEDVLRPLQNLQKIDVSSAKILRAGTIRTMLSLKQLHTVTITNCGIEDMVFSNFASLRHLAVESCTGLKSISFVVCHCPRLHTISVDWTSIQSLQIQACPQLRTISVQGCRLAKVAIISCRRLLRVTNLSALWNFAGAAATESLRLEAVPRLREISLVRCPGLNDADMNSILKQCPQLQRLVLSGCDHLTTMCIPASVIQVCLKSCKRLATVTRAAPCTNASHSSGDYADTVPGSWSLQVLVLDHLPGMSAYAQQAWVHQCGTHLTELTLRRISADMPHLEARFSSVKILAVEQCAHLTSLTIHCPVLEQLRLGGCPKLVDIDFTSPPLESAMQVITNPLMSVRHLTVRGGVVAQSSAPEVVEGQRKYPQSTLTPPMAFVRSAAPPNPEFIVGTCPCLDTLKLVNTGVTPTFLDKIIQEIPTLINIYTSGAINSVYSHSTRIPRFPVPENQPTVKLIVQEAATRRKFTFIVPKCNHVRDIRLQVSARTGIPYEYVTLVYAGARLADNTALHRLDLHPKMPMHLVSVARSKSAAAVLPDFVNVHVH